MKSYRIPFEFVKESGIPFIVGKDRERSET